MKRIISFFVIVLILCVVLVGCSEKADVESTTTTAKNITESSTTETTTERQTEKQTEKQTENRTDENTPTTTTKKYQSNPLVSDEDMEKIENSDAEVYFTDNPENKYIIAIADKSFYW